MSIISIGTSAFNSIGKIKVGTSDVQKIYWGINVIFPSGSITPPSPSGYGLTQGACTAGSATVTLTVTDAPGTGNGVRISDQLYSTEAGAIGGSFTGYLSNPVWQYYNITPGTYWAALKYENNPGVTLTTSITVVC